MEVAEGLPELTAERSCAGGASSGSADIEEPLTPGRTERSTGTSAQQVRVVAVIPLLKYLSLIRVYSAMAM